MTGRGRRTNGTQNNLSSCIWIFFEPRQNFGISAIILFGCIVYTVTFLKKHCTQCSWIESRVFTQFNCEVSATFPIDKCGTKIRCHFSYWKKKTNQVFKKCLMVIIISLFWPEHGKIITFLTSQNPNIPNQTVLRSRGESLRDFSGVYWFTRNFIEEIPMNSNSCAFFNLKSQGTEGPYHTTMFLKVSVFVSTKTKQIFSITSAFSFCFHLCTLICTFWCVLAHHLHENHWKLCCFFWQRIHKPPFSPTRTTNQAF